jgi:hypothetical protein
MDPSSVNMVDARNFEPTEVVVPNANAPRRVSLNAERPSPQSPPRASVAPPPRAHRERRAPRARRAHRASDRWSLAASPPRASHRWPLCRAARIAHRIGGPSAASRAHRDLRAPRRVARRVGDAALSDAARSPQVEPEMPIDPFQEGHAEKQIHTDFYQGFDTKDLAATDLS